MKMGLSQLMRQLHFTYRCSFVVFSIYTEAARLYNETDKYQDIICTMAFEKEAEPEK